MVYGPCPPPKPRGKYEEENAFDIPLKNLL